MAVTPALSHMVLAFISKASFAAIIVDNFN